MPRPDDPNPGLKARKIGNVAVLGGGLMGSGIATVLAMSGIQVTLKEINQKFLDVSVWTGCSVCTPQKKNIHAV